MRIKKVIVKGLFGTFNHEITLNLKDRITIIHAPNGYGKTTILKLIDAILTMKLREIDKIPFMSGATLCPIFSRTRSKRIIVSLTEYPRIVSTAEIVNISTALPEIDIAPTIMITSWIRANIAASA